MLNKLAIAATLAATLVGTAHAQQTTTGVATPAQAQVLNSLPSNSTTVTNYYKQNVYDRSDAKIGEIVRSRPSSSRSAVFSEWVKRT
jgi:hypothetical protein